MSLVARGSSLIVLGGLLSATAEANCPNGLDPATSCRALCTLNSTTHYYDCNMDNTGSGSAATASAVSNATANYHSVWGTAGDGATFCCEVLGSAVGKLFLTGTDQSDYLAFQWQGLYLDDLASGMEGIANGLDQADEIHGSLSTVTSYRDTLNGQEGADDIRGYDGDDYVYGNGGDDFCKGDGGVTTTPFEVASTTTTSVEMTVTTLSTERTIPGTSCGGAREPTRTMVGLALPILVGHRGSAPPDVRCS